MGTDGADITRLLTDWQAGRPEAFERLVPLVWVQEMAESQTSRGCPL